MFIQNNEIPKEFSPNKCTTVLDSKKCFESHISIIKNAKNKRIAKVYLDRIIEFKDYLIETEINF